MLSVKSQHNTVLSQHNCVFVFSHKFILSNSPGFLMLGVDNCGFMLCPSENNQNQQQGQFLFCFCFKYQSQLFYASNTTEKALKKYQIFMGVKCQFFWLLFLYFILLLLFYLLIFFFGGGRGLFCFVFIVAVMTQHSTSQVL